MQGTFDMLILGVQETETYAMLRIAHIQGWGQSSPPPPKMRLRFPVNAPNPDQC